MDICNEFSAFCALRCRAACLVYFLGLRTKAARNTFISHWSFIRASCFTNATSPIKQLTLLVGGQLRWWFLTKQRTKSSLHCNHTFRSVIPEHTLGSLHLRRPFYKYGVRIAGVTTWKIKCRDFIT